MEYAQRLGRRALGTTAENPNVGCVIVKDDRVLGVGWTQPGGRPHAETEALKMAGDCARGATAYVTLEPCAHQGRTPPCARALVTAGIARVVTAIEDPDPRVSGRGLAILRQAGIAVDVGLCADEARHDLAGFLTRIIRKRPYVILKLAVSADGKIAARPGMRTPITGAEANARVQGLRAQCDAILVGMGTVRADDPSLTCRLPGLQNRSPKPYVLGHGPIPSGSKLATRGAEVVQDLSTVSGINRLLVEGGARTACWFLEQRLVDEFHLYRSPAKLGPDGLDAIARMPLEEALKPFTLREQETLGTDTLSIYVPSPKGEGRTCSPASSPTLAP
jgi:diaminohydroxyphosphoribosylaminopyrimidine deaminase / 5-amino-6-(5-phosphoribosylamino)uracil reductase